MVKLPDTKSVPYKSYDAYTARYALVVEFSSKMSKIDRNIMETNRTIARQGVHGVST